MYLIDTNIAIALFAGDEVVKEKVRNAEFIYRGKVKKALGQREAAEIDFNKAKELEVDK